MPAASNRRLSLTAGLVVVLVVALVGGIAIGHRRSSSGTITVTGSGTATGSPDTVSFQIAVSTTGTSTASALAANNARTRAVEAALLAHGATKAGIATSGLNVSSTTNNQGVITGYSVYDELTVTSHRLARTGAMIGAAVTAAGNAAQLSGITYSITNQSTVLAAARAKAVTNAHTAATQLARAAGATLGSVTSLVDEENSQPVIYPGTFMYGAVKATSAVPVRPGTQSVSVTVKVVYALS